MITKNAAWAIACFVLQLLGGALILWILFIFAFFVRDGFCSPEAPAMSFESWGGFTLLGTLAFAPAAILAWTRLRRPLLVLLPWIAVDLAFASIVGSSLMIRIANDAHCAAGLAHEQEQTVIVSKVPRVIGQMSTIFALAALVATLVIAGKIGEGRTPQESD